MKSVFLLTFSVCAATLASPSAYAVDQKSTYLNCADRIRAAAHWRASMIHSEDQRNIRRLPRNQALSRLNNLTIYGAMAEYPAVQYVVKEYGQNNIMGTAFFSDLSKGMHSPTWLVDVLLQDDGFWNPLVMTTANAFRYGFETLRAGMITTAFEAELPYLTDAELRTIHQSEELPRSILRAARGFIYYNGLISGWIDVDQRISSELEKMARSGDVDFLTPLETAERVELVFSNTYKKELAKLEKRYADTVKAITDSLLSDPKWASFLKRDFTGYILPLLTRRLAKVQDPEPLEPISVETTLRSSTHPDQAAELIRIANELNNLITEIQIAHSRIKSFGRNGLDIEALFETAAHYQGLFSGAREGRHMEP